MDRQAIIVTDVSYGDAGKGTMVDYLVRRAESAVVVRHNGGPQAAHNVVTPDGRHHTFSQFGSGSFVPGVRTHLSEFMMINPLNMFREAQHLRELGVSDIWQRISIDENAVVILPWHQSANRLRELARGSGRHGSCGEGIGEAKVDELQGLGTIRAGDLRKSYLLRRKLEDLREAKYRELTRELDVPPSAEAERAWATFANSDLVPWLREQYDAWSQLVDIVDVSYLERLSREYRTLVFEGAQGVLLDEWHGFYPYTTWSTTTHANALAVLDRIGYDQLVARLGVMRGYMTRHGAGPFVTEDAELTARLPDYHNGRNAWQEGFRVGRLDLVAHRYALRACKGADALAVTGLDRLQSVGQWWVCDRYRYLGDDPDAADYLESDDAGLVSDIRLVPVGDWHNPPVRQAQLLERCEPVYQPVPRSADAIELLQTIEDGLGLPVSITSFGPTAADKRVLLPSATR
jgi:adenylosuccinate synthase